MIPLELLRQLKEVVSKVVLRVKELEQENQQLHQRLEVNEGKLSSLKEEKSSLLEEQDTIRKQFEFLLAELGSVQVASSNGTSIEKAQQGAKSEQVSVAGEERVVRESQQSIGAAEEGQPIFEVPSTTPKTQSEQHVDALKSETKQAFSDNVQENQLQSLDMTLGLTGESLFNHSEDNANEKQKLKDQASN